MLTWCSSAVNFSFLSFFAASRTRSSPLCPLPRRGVRRELGSGVCSLVSGLPSTTSAGGCPLLFGCFVSTTPLYDSPPPCMEGLWLIAFSSRPAHYVRAVTGSPGSRAWSFYACLGSSTPQDRDTLALARTAVLPSVWADNVGIPYSLFRSSIPSLHIPLSNASSATLPLPSHGSGPEWLATPSLYDSFIRYSMPVYPGAIQTRVSAPRYGERNSQNSYLTLSDAPQGLRRAQEQLSIRD